MVETVCYSSGFQVSFIPVEYFDNLIMHPSRCYVPVNDHGVWFVFIATYVFDYVVVPHHNKTPIQV
jgi:hypothetical protein